MITSNKDLTEIQLMWATYNGFTDMYLGVRIVFSMIATNPKYMGKGGLPHKNGFAPYEIVKMCNEEMRKL